MTQRWVELDRTRALVEIKGEGPALVFLHAGICDARQWDDQWNLFSREWRAIRYDRRGFGTTPMPEGPYAHHHDLLRVLDDLGIDRASLVGCSQGGKTAIDFALEHPGRVDALVLVASALSGFAFESPRWDRADALEAAERANDIDRVNELELDYWLDGPAQASGRVKASIRERVRAMNRIALAMPQIGTEAALDPPAAGRLAEIKAPTLVIAGDFDQARTLAAAEHLTASLPDATKIIMSGTAHLPNMERAVEFNATLSAFLDARVRMRLPG